MKTSNLLWAVVILCTATLVGCTKENNSDNQQAKMQLAVEHLAGAKTLQLNVDMPTPNGEPIRYTVFKYYLSNLTLLNDRGEPLPSSPSYFLIDESDASSKQLQFNIPAGSYSGIRFLLGVDSARNVSGVQEGALDPAKGMFWTWNTGYIMAKLEGKSIISTAPLQNVTYHIGGFRQANSVLKTITIPFGRTLTVDANKQLEVKMNGDLDKWWKGVNTIRIADNALIMEAGPDAVKVANNYANMFSLKEVQVR